jgi:hypothetical protein
MIFFQAFRQILFQPVIAQQRFKGHISSFVWNEKLKMENGKLRSRLCRQIERIAGGNTTIFNFEFSIPFGVKPLA